MTGPATAAVAAEETMTLICNQCGYRHDGDTPPDVCPICGADKTAFAPRKGKLNLEIEEDK